MRERERECVCVFARVIKKENSFCMAELLELHVISLE